MQLRVEATKNLMEMHTFAARRSVQLEQASNVCAVPCIGQHFLAFIYLKVRLKYVSTGPDDTKWTGMAQV